MVGKSIKWTAVNGVVSGTVLRRAVIGVGDWVVSIASGKTVIVNEKSIING